MSVAEILQVDRQFIDGGHLGRMADDGFHGDEGEIQGHRAVAAPFILQSHGVLVAGVGVVLRIGLPVQPGERFAVLHIIHRLTIVRHDKVQMAGAVALGDGIVVLAGVHRGTEGHPVPSVRIALADTHSVVKMIVGVSGDEQTVIVVATIVEGGRTHNPGRVDVVRGEMAALVVQRHRVAPYCQGAGRHKGDDTVQLFLSTP